MLLASGTAYRVTVEETAGSGDLWSASSSAGADDFHAAVLAVAGDCWFRGSEGGFPAASNVTGTAAAGAPTRSQSSTHASKHTHPKKNAAAR